MSTQPTKYNTADGIVLESQPMINGTTHVCGYFHEEDGCNCGEHPAGPFFSPNSWGFMIHSDLEDLMPTRGHSHLPDKYHWMGRCNDYFYVATAYTQMASTALSTHPYIVDSIYQELLLHEVGANDKYIARLVAQADGDPLRYAPTVGTHPTGRELAQFQRSLKRNSRIHQEDPKASQHEITLLRMTYEQMGSSGHTGAEERAHYKMNMITLDNERLLKEEIYDPPEDSVYQFSPGNPPITDPLSQQPYHEAPTLPAKLYKPDVSQRHAMINQPDWSQLITVKLPTAIQDIGRNVATIRAYAQLQRLLSDKTPNDIQDLLTEIITEIIPQLYGATATEYAQALVRGVMIRREDFEGHTLLLHMPTRVFSSHTYIDNMGRIIIPHYNARGQTYANSDAGIVLFAHQKSNLIVAEHEATRCTYLTFYDEDFNRSLSFSMRLIQEAFTGGKDWGDMLKRAYPLSSRLGLAFPPYDFEESYLHDVGLEAQDYPFPPDRWEKYGLNVGDQRLGSYLMNFDRFLEAIAREQPQNERQIREAMQRPPHQNRQHHPAMVRELESNHLTQEEGGGRSYTIYN